MGAAVEAPTSVCNGHMLRVLSSDLLSMSNMPLPILGIEPCVLVALGSRNLLKREASAHPQSKIQIGTQSKYRPPHLITLKPPALGQQRKWQLAFRVVLDSFLPSMSQENLLFDLL